MESKKAFNIYTRTDLDGCYHANSMRHVQMRFTVSMHEIEPKALKAPLAAAIQFMYDL